MFDIDREQEIIRKDVVGQIDRLDALRLSAEMLNKIIKESSIDFYTYFDDRIYGMNIGFTLGSEQSVADVKPLLAAIAKTRQYKPAERREHYENSGMVGWLFAHKTTRFANLTVVVNVNASKTCRKVATGETQPVYKIVCDDASEVAL